MHIHIRKTGMYIEITDDSGTRFDEISTLNLPLSYYLPYIVTVEKDLTFGELLGVLAPYAEHITWLFLGYIKNFELAELLNPIQQGDDVITSEINSIGFIWESEITYRQDERLPEIDTWPGCVGVRSKKNDAYIEINFIDFDLSNMYHLLTKPVFIDTYLEYGETDPTGKYSSSLVGYKEWSLHDLISAVLSLGKLIVEEEEDEEEEDDDVIDRQPENKQEIPDTITATLLLEILDNMEKPTI